MLRVIYHSPSVIFLIFRIQEETYWNSLPYIFQSNIIVLGAPRPHYIFMSSDFLTIPFPGKGNNHQNPTVKIASLFGQFTQFVSMVFAVPYREWLLCVKVYYSSSTPFGGDGTLNQHRSMQCLHPFIYFTGCWIAVCCM